MTAPDRVNVEKLIVAYLDGHAEVTGHVGTETVADNPSIRVTRIGGATRTHGWMDRAHIQLDVYADDQESAHDEAAKAWTALQDAPSATHPLGVVTAVEDGTGFGWKPDQPGSASARPRYTFTVYVAVHPNPS